MRALLIINLFLLSSFSYGQVEFIKTFDISPSNLWFRNFHGSDTSANIYFSLSASGSLPSWQNTASYYKDKKDNIHQFKVPFYFDVAYDPYEFSNITYFLNPGYYFRFLGGAANLIYYTPDTTITTYYIDSIPIPGRYTRSPKAFFNDSSIFLITGTSFYTRHKGSGILMEYNRNTHKTIEHFHFDLPGRGLVNDFEVNLKDSTLKVLRSGAQLIKYDIKTGNKVDSSTAKILANGNYANKISLSRFDSSFSFVFEDSSTTGTLYLSDSLGFILDSIVIDFDSMLSKNWSGYAINPSRFLKTKVIIGVNYFLKQNGEYFLRPKIVIVDLKTKKITSLPLQPVDSIFQQIVNKIYLSREGVFYIGGSYFRGKTNKIVNDDPKAFLCRVDLSYAEPLFIPEKFNPSDRLAFVFPNPTKGSIKINLKDANEIIQKVEVYGLNGNKVWGNSYYENYCDVNLGRDLPSAVYLLKIITDKKTYFEKISFLPQ